MSHHDHLADEVERSIDTLDGVLRDLRTGPRTARQYDQLEELAQGAVQRVIEAFRGSAARPATIRVTPGRNGGVWC